MSYKVVKTDKGKFAVIEIASENVIDEYDSHKKAHEVYRSLKSLKKGFEGWTPNFFIKNKVI